VVVICRSVIVPQAVEERRAALLEDNMKDERLLRQLAKSLKMKKKKSNKLPLAFINDGLDCIHLSVIVRWMSN